VRNDFRVSATGRAPEILSAWEPVNRPLWWRAVILVLVGWMFLPPVSRLPHIYFGLDEFEHLHFAFCIHRGMLPYRDFFENHLPWLHYMLSWLFPITGETITTILVARWMMLGFTLVTLFFTYYLAREVYDWRVGVVAVFLLSCIVMFHEKAFEIRPDVPATTCWLAGLWLVVRAMQTNQPRLYVVAGLVLGSGFMFTQKLMFGIAGVLLGLAWLLLDGRLARRSPSPTRSSLLFLPSLAVPFLLTLAFFSVHAGVGPLVRDNFAMTSHWVREISPSVYLVQLVRQNPFVAVLGLAGWLIALGGLLARNGARPGAVVLVAATLTAVIGLFVIPVPYRQYFLVLLPLWAIHGAALLWKIVELPSLKDLLLLWKSPSQRKAIVLSAVALLAIGWGLIEAASAGPPAPEGDAGSWAVWWAMIGVGGILMLLQRPWQRALGMLGIGLLVYAGTPMYTMMKFQFPLLVSLLAAVSLIVPVRLRLLTLLLVGLVPSAHHQVIRDTNQSNDHQLKEVRYVLEHSRPDEAFFTGFRLTGAFRPHAYFYYMLHVGVRAMLTQRQLSGDLVEALQATRPKLVAYDTEVQKLPSVVQDYIKQHYRPVGVGSLWERKD
jgi:hypothetical protein